MILAPAAAPATLDVVRHAVRALVDDTPELRQHPQLRRRIATNMVGVSLAAADLLDAERRLTHEIRGRSRSNGARPRNRRAPLASAQAAGDIHRRTAVNSAAGVLQATKDAIDFPGFVTSLITGVFQAMTTSTLQQLEAYASLLEAVNTSTAAFAATSITPGRAATWAVSQFPELEITGDDPPALAIREDAEMPSAEALKAALEATDDEVSEVDEDDLESTLLPLVRRKLARDRQSMLATMVLMGMNRIVVDAGKIHASMELQVDARSTAEQTEASRFDTRVTTGGSGSFGSGMWGASAHMSATVGYVKSDQQFTREDIALRAGLRSSVDVGFHTEPINTRRMVKPEDIEKLATKSRVPETEASLLSGNDKKTAVPDFGTVPTSGDLEKLNQAEAQKAEAARKEAEKKEAEKKKAEEAKKAKEAADAAKAKEAKDAAAKKGTAADPAAKTETKPEAKTDTKTDAKPDPKAAGKPDTAKPDAKTEAKPDAAAKPGATDPKTTTNKPAPVKV